MWPLLFTVAGVSGETIAPGASLGPVRFRWPEDGICTGLLVVPRSGLASDLGGLSLAITDEESNQLIVDDGIGGELSPLAFGGLELPFWPGFPLLRPCPLKRPLFAGDFWSFTVRNGNAGAVASNLYLFFEPQAR